MATNPKESNMLQRGTQVLVNRPQDRLQWEGTVTRSEGDTTYVDVGIYTKPNIKLCNPGEVKALPAHRVQANEVQKGDSVAKRARGPYAEVTSVQVLTSGQRRLWLAGGGYLRGAKVFSQSATLNSAVRQTKTSNRGTRPKKGAKVATGNTNSAKRKAATLKAGKCSVCGEKPKQLYAVVTKGGAVKVVKAREGRAPYCKKHAERKQAIREYKQGEQKLKRTRKASKAKAKPKRSRKAGTGSTSRSRSRGKKATAKKATTRKRAPRKAAAKGKATRKPRSKAKASSSGKGDPF